MNLMEELARLGRGVPGAENHGWRRRSIQGGIVAHPDPRLIQRINVAGDIDLVLQPGPPALWVLGMSETDVRRVTHQMLGGTLRLSHQGERVTLTKAWPFSGDAGDIKGERSVVVVSLPTIPAVTHEGGGDVYVYQLDQDEIFLSQMGEGNLFAHGKVSGLAVTLAGNGEVDARQLASGVTVTALRGDGKVEVMATSSASSRLTGNGIIRIHGAPAQVMAEVAGGGKIEYA